MDLERILAVGEKLGLDGAKLQEFIQKQQELEEKKVLEEERRRKEEMQQKMEEEKAKEEREFQKEKLAMEREERAAERELQKLRLEKEIEEAKMKNASSSGEHRSAKAPKLPLFNEDRDDIDAYIERFERYAKAQNWKQTEWATNLSALLSGKALEVYYRMPSTSASNYDDLKTALLKRYNHTEEGFRDLFRSSKAEKGESPQQYFTRLENYLLKWMTLGGVSATYDELLGLVVRDQFLCGCHEDLATYLRERKPKEGKDLIQATEVYLEAHGGDISHPSRGKLKTERDNRNSLEARQNREPKKFVPMKDRICYRCQKPGHHAKDCGKPSDDRVCFLCNKRGHVAKNCISVKNSAAGAMYESESNTYSCHPEGQDENTRVELGCSILDHRCRCSDFCAAAGGMKPDMGKACSCLNLPTAEGYVNRQPVTVMRDSGSTCVIVSRKIVSPHQYTGEERYCILGDTSSRKLQVARVYVDSPYYTGETRALVMATPLFDCMIGNVQGAFEANHPNQGWNPQHQQGSEVTAGVTTRSQVAKENKPIKPLKVPEPALVSTDKEELIKEQEADESLKTMWEKAKTKEPPRMTKTAQTWFEVQDGILYRCHQMLRGVQRPIIKQLAVPEGRRQQVLKLAHESIMAGHQGIRRTSDRVLSSFYWPGIHGDVTRFCQSCDVCQRTIQKGRVPKAALEDMPIIDVPFKRIAIDIVGPINPMSERKNRYILTVVDFATRYPEAVALPSIETERVAEALLEIYSRVGFPSEVLSDRGSNFTSDMMKEVNRLISVRQLTTTPYHPICNGLCERFNGTLKMILKRLCAEKPRDWDRYLPAVLFAYREVPQESLKFSPFELLYGRSVRGPMSILKTLWTKEVNEDDVQTSYSYVLNLRERLEETCKLAHEELGKAQVKYKKNYDRTSRCRTFQVGDKVLILLPTEANKLIMQWKGPFPVRERTGKNDYKIEVKGKSRTFHVNMLKKYISRQDEIALCSLEQHGHVWDIVNTAVIEEEDDDTQETEGILKEEDLLDVPTTGGSETYLDVRYGSSLTPEKETEAQKVVSDFGEIFTDKPGLAEGFEHKINLTSEVPIRQKPYPLPYALKNIVDEEIKKMLAADIIEESDSPYSAPIVLVKKKDETYRFCVDYRMLNRITIFDSEPSPQADAIFAMLAGDKFFSKLDFTKGYWQIPVRVEDRPKTAFSIPNGHHYQFKRMPFGLTNSGATFNRMIRKVLAGIIGADNFVDDVLGHTPTWPAQLDVLREVFQRVKDNKLTLKPSKCEIGCDEVAFVGQYLREGEIHPQKDKVSEIVEAPVPKTKRQVRSFLGLVGYYRSYIPNFANLAAPLSDLTKKGEPSLVRWGEAEEEAFQKLKKTLTEAPILRMPEFDRQFIVQTDASDNGVGAALLQEFDEGRFPVAYASKKLLSRERNYSVVEKECLAVVWAVKKFVKYLYGKEFVLETDHQSLSYLNSAKFSNSRLMRWALYLQNYRFRVQSIEGRFNVVADYLSRAY